MEADVRLPVKRKTKKKGLFWTWQFNANDDGNSKTRCSYNTSRRLRPITIARPDAATGNP